MFNCFLRCKKLQALDWQSVQLCGIKMERLIKSRHLCRCSFTKLFSKSKNNICIWFKNNMIHSKVWKTVSVFIISIHLSHSDLSYKTAFQNIFQHLIFTAKNNERDSFIFLKCFRTKWEINQCFHHCMHSRAEVHYRLCWSAELQILSFLHGAQMSISEHEQQITAVERQRCSWWYLFKLFFTKRAW